MTWKTILTHHVCDPLENIVEIFMQMCNYSLMKICIDTETSSKWARLVISQIAHYIS